MINTVDGDKATGYPFVPADLYFLSKTDREQYKPIEHYMRLHNNDKKPDD